MESPVLGGERVSQNPQNSIKRFSVAVIPEIKPDRDVRLIVLRRLPETHRNHRRPPRERALEHHPDFRHAHPVDHVIRRERIRESHRSSASPPRLPVEVSVVTRGVDSMRGGVGDAAPRRHDGRYSIGVEFPCDWQAEALLVTEDGGLELGIEGVREVGRCFGESEVSETVEVLFEFRHAADVAASLGVQELGEIVPRGVVRLCFLGFGGYYGCGFWYDPGGKTRVRKEDGHTEEEQVKVTEKQKHNYSLW